MRIATFNVQNLRLRRPQGRARLDGARDGDLPRHVGPGAAALDYADRRLTARVIADADADIVCLQEVFDAATLDYFHDHLLRHAGACYPHRVCLPGNDGRGRDLAVMSRRPLDEVASHAALTPADLGLEPPAGLRADFPVFRRDCLLARVGALTLFLCHFKAPYPDPEAAWPVRRLEALAVRRLVERRFAAAPEGLWLILGDLNEPHAPQGERAIAPLVDGFAVDLLARLPAEKRWSFHDRDGGFYSRPDAMLASPALARRWSDARPRVLREGLSRAAMRHDGARLEDVGEERPHASDHAAMVLDLDGLA
ncbi:endonuclease/exonuclease/phosphatase family protein [Rhodobacteraceae bacterium WD3A24]|nr:endonuclease/exonuclease/phosphatase family protein [Rhodobacteraceae bacterium WD3A24]